MTYLLSEKYPLETLKTLLISQADWHPYPTIDEHDAWEALPTSVRTAYTAEGEAVTAADWPQTLAVRYLDFARDGNRNRYSKRLLRTASTSGRPHHRRVYGSAGSLPRRHRQRHLADLRGIELVRRPPTSDGSAPDRACPTPPNPSSISLPPRPPRCSPGCSICLATSWTPFRR